MLIYLSDYIISSRDFPQYVPVDTFGLDLISVWRHDRPNIWIIPGGLFHVFALYHFIGLVSL